MSDFLRNLRSSHKKEQSIPRRNQGGNYYPQKERRHMSDRRSNHSEGLEILWSCLNDILPELTDNTTQLIQHIQTRKAKDPNLLEAKIRQHNAIADFFDNLNKLFSEVPIPHTSGRKTKATTSYASGTHYTKDDILTIIRDMRSSGTTFAIIAEYLRDKGIPTFSGRGDWHAQTIHRLCK
ncbi:MAG: hypothetical protein L3J69_02470 [Desulfobacula sp.]|nr:hypothetical protein [Desulfobacula sp.]